MPELAELKPGDEVAERVGYSNDYRLHKIAKIEWPGGNGIIILENGMRYRMSNGTSLRKGDRWSRPDPILPVTDTIRLAIKKNKLVNQLSGIGHNHWKSMSIETLEAVSELVWKELGEKE